MLKPNLNAVDLSGANLRLLHGEILPHTTKKSNVYYVKCPIDKLFDEIDKLFDGKGKYDRK